MFSAKFLFQVLKCLRCEVLSVWPGLQVFGMGSDLIPDHIRQRKCQCHGACFTCSKKLSFASVQCSEIGWTLNFPDVLTQRISRLLDYLIYSVTRGFFLYSNTSWVCCTISQFCQRLGYFLRQVSLPLLEDFIAECASQPIIKHIR